MHRRAIRSRGHAAPPQRATRAARARSLLVLSPVSPPPLSRSILLRFDVPSLEGDPSSIVLLDRRGTILWANRAWHEFFDRNGGGSTHSPVAEGANYLEGIRGRLHDFYVQVFATCLETGLPYEQDYECSSPAELRDYRLRILPVDGDLLVAHTLRTARPRDVPPAAEGTAVDDLRRFVRPDGLLLQCSNCRRLRATDRASWEWVPDVVVHPRDNVSHGLCHLCQGFYHGALGSDDV